MLRGNARTYLAYGASVADSCNHSFSSSDMDTENKVAALTLTCSTRLANSSGQGKLWETKTESRNRVTCDVHRTIWFITSHWYSHCSMHWPGIYETSDTHHQNNLLCLVHRNARGTMISTSSHALVKGALASDYNVFWFNRIGLQLGPGLGKLRSPKSFSA